MLILGKDINVLVSFAVAERSMGTARLNFHHLHYFFAVAKDGNLTRTAARLRVSQSALSAQIRQLEEQLGVSLFLRESRRLLLTEVGRLVLRYAEDIFHTEGELLATVKSGRRREGILSLGAVSTLSRNFQESFVMPILGEANATLRLVSGAAPDLLARLARHELDLVLANRPAKREPGRAFRSHRVAKQEVSVVGRRRTRHFRFPDDLAFAPMILPGPDSELRVEFDALCEQLGVKVKVRAEVDDMALMRLLVRDGDALALVPSVVVRDELRTGALRELCVVPGLLESFYAITVDRQFQHPLVRQLLARDEDEILAMGR
jgi:LysR family transcriptional activator of nhaA